MGGPIWGGVPSSGGGGWHMIDWLRTPHTACSMPSLGQHFLARGCLVKAWCVRRRGNLITQSPGRPITRSPYRALLLMPPHAHSAHRRGTRRSCRTACNRQLLQHSVLGLRVLAAARARPQSTPMMMRFAFFALPRARSPSSWLFRRFGCFGKRMAA